MKVIIPIQKNPYQHWSVQDISFLYVYDTLMFSEEIINKTHNDYPCNNIQNFIDGINDDCVIYRKKCISTNFGYDLELLYWLKTNHRIEVNHNTIIRQYWNWYHDDTNVNDFIPITKWLEFCKDIKDTFISEVKSVNDVMMDDTSLKEYQQFISNLALIESYGLFTNK